MIWWKRWRCMKEMMLIYHIAPGYTWLHNNVFETQLWHIWEIVSVITYSLQPWLACVCVYQTSKEPWDRSDAIHHCTLCHRSLRGQKGMAEIKQADITEGVLVPAVLSHQQSNQSSIQELTLSNIHTRLLCNQTATSTFLTSADVSNCRLKQAWKPNVAWIKRLPRRLAHCLIGSWRTEIQMHSSIQINRLPT